MLIPDIYEVCQCYGSRIGPPTCWMNPPSLISRLSMVSHLALSINSSANFLVYVAWGTKFKKAIWRAADNLGCHAGAGYRDTQSPPFSPSFLLSLSRHSTLGRRGGHSQRRKGPAIRERRRGNSLALSEMGEEASRRQRMV